MEKIKGTLKLFFPLVPSVMLSLDTEFADQDFMFWKEDLPTPKSLAGELRRWKQLWSNENPETQSVPSSLVEALRHAMQIAIETSTTS